MSLRPLLVTAMILGCSERAPAPIQLPECNAGAVVACLCSGDRQGWRTCGANQRLSECLCADGGAVTTPPPLCSDPFARCGDQCVNLLTDQSHCGRCGASCPAGQICLGASCALLADAQAPRDVVAPDAPDAETPDAGEPLDAETPDAPDAETLAVPDAVAPDAPDTTDAEAPDAPDAEAPDAEAPDAEAPDAAPVDATDA
ncbi:MAG: hypothetical protein R3A48_25035 [Polyangiales bacterium]